MFICVFVLLSALAAFWPPDFFSNNLANLDQLNKWLPFIMLVFIPAITMSIWAEERRQGTDELLLTLPASDFDVVLGKYLAGVAIFTVALLFSMFSIYLVFSYGLGAPDVGLVRRHVHRLLVRRPGDARHRHGGVVPDEQPHGRLHPGHGVQRCRWRCSAWPIGSSRIRSSRRRSSGGARVEQFRDFERGVISLGGISYFVMIAVVMLYISMVLIGRRHWGGREEDESMWAALPGPHAGSGGAGDRRQLFLSHHNLLAGRYHQRKAQLAVAADD